MDQEMDSAAERQKPKAGTSLGDPIPPICEL